MGINRLRKSEKCPIHGSYFCCGRAKRAERIEQKRKYREPRKPGSMKWTLVSPGVWRIADPTVERGYRERRSKGAMRTLLFQKIREQDGCCCICGKEFEEIGEVVPEHKEPRGMGAARRDDHPDNIGAAHAICNGEKGSQRDYCPPKGGTESGEVLNLE